MTVDLGDWEIMEPVPLKFHSKKLRAYVRFIYENLTESCSIHLYP